MNFLSKYIKRLRFKFIVIVYIMGSLLWGISQYKDKIDLGVLKTVTMEDTRQNTGIDSVDQPLEEKKPMETLTKQRFTKNEPALHLQKNVLLNNGVVFQGKAFVTSGVTFKLFTPVAQSWRKHITRTVHLYGVDTCALRQKAKLNDQEWHCGVVTTAWLVTKTLGQNLSCKQALMHNGISYAQCFIEGIDLAEVGLAEGMLVLSKENKNPLPVQYRIAEETARNKKIGLWSSEFTKPSQWRRDNGSYNPFAGL
ncbi:nuclease [Bartonella vinsonii]|uniref:nuclease n=1 Tax=Bartonella vinsonii TaxID=33047 RepID=UPI0002B6CA50|nr:nuclease [Bartonella vinsonii]AGF76298.1 putative nuclease [Bartonella vinsonii subsp. berkhoffii str. Winnie]